MSALLTNIGRSVEAVVLHHGKVLLTKRADNCRVAPGVWNVPAGKVKKSESPEAGVVRETLEETGLNVDIVKLLANQTFDITDGGTKVPRQMYTYLTAISSKHKAVANSAAAVAASTFPQVTLNKEHSAFIWVSESELKLKEYDSVMPRLRTIINTAFEPSK